jgi:hypothetical protein
MTQQAYIQAIRHLYLQLPNTHRRFSRSDRQLASVLYQRGFSFDLVRSALLLATARRLVHDPTSPLPPVRSLYYFLPVIEEIQRQSLPSGYVQYLEHKIRSLSPASPPRPAAAQTGA